MTLANAALLGAALLLALLVAAQALLPVFARRRALGIAHARYAAALARAHEKGRSSSERAGAFREAATLALDELRRARTACRWALEADRVHPGDPETIALVARALTRARRPVALERFLWRALDRHRGAPGHAAAFEALVALYEGPLRAPERARVLRDLAGTPAALPAPPE